VTERLTCIVPGCKRTHAPLWDEWICAKHWPLVPRDMRRAYAHARRRKKARSVLVRLWARCKRAAIEENFMRATL